MYILLLLLINTLVKILYERNLMNIKHFDKYKTNLLDSYFYSVFPEKI